MTSKPKAMSPDRQAWLDIAEAFEELHTGLIDRFEFNLKWAEFMHKKEVLRQRKLKEKASEASIG